MQMFACYDKIRTSCLFDYVPENVSGEEKLPVDQTLEKNSDIII